MKSLRLLVTEECHRKCPGCCNKDWDLSKLPLVDLHHYRKFDEILLTGGEPLCNIGKTIQAIDNIRSMNKHANIYIYTNKLDDFYLLLSMWYHSDGLTITLHDQEDADKFVDIYRQLPDWVLRKSNRLNIFKNININDNWLAQFNDKYDEYFGEIDGFVTKYDIEWIKDCPLPKNETFMRL